MNLLDESGRLEERISATIQKERAKLSQTMEAVREETARSGKKRC
jgi:hypothetical protein